MKKSDLIDAIQVTVAIKKKDIDATIQALCSVIRSQVKEGNEVRILEIGTFKRVQKPERTARNPRTGEVVQVPAKAVVKFVPVKGFMD